jgi:hypothetical protein
MGAPLALGTAFGAEVRRLGLNTQTCASSKELRRWCELNKDRCYIPEWLLKAWGIYVSEDADTDGRTRVA